MIRLASPPNSELPPSPLAQLPVPGARRRNHYERRLQISFVRRFRRLVDPSDAVLIAYENGEGRSAETLELLEALGFVWGLADLILLLPGARMRWIEVKLERTLRHDRTRPSQVQRSAHRLLIALGHRIDVVRSWSELVAIARSEGVPMAEAPPLPYQPTFDFRRRRRALTEQRAA